MSIFCEELVAIFNLQEAQLGSLNLVERKKKKWFSL